MVFSVVYYLIDLMFQTTQQEHHCRGKLMSIIPHLYLAGMDLTESENTFKRN